MRRAASLPERLRSAGATALERRLLEAAAEEEPSPELRQRMAGAIGISAAAIGAGAAVGATKLGAEAGRWSSVPLWLPAGIASIAVAGAVAGVHYLGSYSAAMRGASGTLGAHPSVAATPVSSAPSVLSAPPPSEAASAPLPAVPPAPAVPQAAVVSSPSSVAAPVRSRPERASATASSIEDQIALIDTARTAVSAGSGDRALEILRQYYARYPSGSFNPEAAALKIEALAALGRKAEARTLAEGFVAEYGASPLADRVARVALRPP